MAPVFLLTGQDMVIDDTAAVSRAPELDLSRWKEMLAVIFR